MTSEGVGILLRMHSGEHDAGIAQRLAGPATIAVVAALAALVVTLPLNAAVKQREFWAVAASP